jgi:hypothetical protein
MQQTSELRTHALELAEKYRRLGGTRLAKMDDNFIDTRIWDEEPYEASEFWREQVEVLDDKAQAEVVSHLKSLNS